MNELSNIVIAQGLNEPSEDKVNAIFNQQKEYALELRSSSINDRKAILKKFITIFEKYTPEMIEAGKKDFNKPETETLLSEIFPVIHEAKHTIKHLAKWAKPKKVATTKVSFGTKSKIIYEPRGVCLIVSPWNYPINLSFCPLISAIAAGNTAIIKPSEFTPHLSNVITNIINECFDKKHVAVFEGNVDVSLVLLEKPFDHIFFTGSPQVGKSVMAAAAKNLTSVTLELGGKSPVIVDETTNLSKTAGKIAWGKFTNSGQTCIAPDYVLVHESKLNELIFELKKSITAAYGSNIKNNVDYGRIVNVAHTKRIEALVNDGVNNAGKIIFGGEVDSDQRYISPTLIVGDFSNDTFINCSLMQDEIFGPVLPIIPYKDINDAIAQINKLPKPLALYVFSKNRNTVDQVLQQTSSGGSCINTSIIHFIQSNLPFGGVNNSGIGSAHGVYGFKAFSHERGVLEDKFTSNHFLYPPYTSKVKSLVKLIFKYAA